MRIPSRELSTRTLLDLHGAYLGARLKVDPRTVGLHPAFLQATAALRAADERQRRALAELQEAQSARDYAAFVLDDVLGQFEPAVLTAAGRDRRGALFRRYFPKSLSLLVRLRPAEQVEWVRSIETDLAEATAPAALRPWLPRLAELRAKLEKAIDAWREASIARSTARFAERHERSRWLYAYQAVHADLIKAFPGARRKVESFFRRAPAPDVEDDPAA